jgi:hypothetical protein
LFPFRRANFFNTLGEYYSAVGEALKADAKRAHVLPNPSDKGGIRELVYSKELLNHLPSGCAVRFGGFLFNASGAQSSQLDILVLSDSVPQFNVLGKSFSPIDGTAAVVEIKSNLQEKKLFEALTAFSTLPDKLPYSGRAPKDYKDWPCKIIYAHDGMKISTALKKLKKYYDNNSKIPIENRPNIIHVCGEYVIFREPGNDKFQEITNLSDVFGLAWSFLRIQSVAISQRSILIDYMDYLSPLFDTVMTKNMKEPPQSAERKK